MSTTCYINSKKEDKMVFFAFVLGVILTGVMIFVILPSGLQKERKEQKKVLVQKNPTIVRNYIFIVGDERGVCLPKNHGL